ncbi:protein of unknown function [Parasphingorhabdus marina DSM 22363]|uniref:DUF4279 domain-containing protein n=1 Tax=Parasphingorhabdus marina DSM 22363 TaxID=1123272 RepID=A0A1N6GG87_9SPHN|nr:DUF4279 domain-containing protein [Parasphingorhabdus marina]SIO06570.1 protein of unknown function [Parasphingorhabdus marina DSM 22363]
MGILHKSAVSLGFYNDDLDPSRISEILGAEPDVGVKKGDVWKTVGGVEKVAITGSWRIGSERRSPGDVDGQIQDIFGKLESDIGVWRQLSELYQGRVFCGLFLASGNEGIRLQPETVAAIGERSLLLDFDIYGAELPD